jgi:hypothetical protein
MHITVTQYLRPHGKQVQANAPISDDYQEQYETMQKCGARLTAEVLTTGEVSITIEDPLTKNDFDNEICANNPEVTKAMEALLGRFDETKYKTWQSGER